MPDVPAGPRRISVMIVDDSAFMRQHLRAILERDPGIGPVVIARDGQDALRKLAQDNPDVVTLDINMPVMDGLETLRRIMAESPRPCLMLSSLTQEGAAETLEALELGAVDVFGKPSGSVSLDIDRYASEITARVKAAARARFRIARLAAGRVGVPDSPGRPPAQGAASEQEGGSRPSLQPVARTASAPAASLAQWAVAIGVSTGGPRTLMDILPKLPGDLPAAVIIVQHLPATFTRAFAERLNNYSELRVKEAEQGEPICAGTAYVAPGGVHLTLRTSRIGGGAIVHLTPEPANTAHRPSADVMMRSVLEVFQARMVGVLLTGMGSDGADAMVAARQAGATTIAESQETAVVFGMPKEAIVRGGASVVAPAPRVAEEIVRALPGNKLSG